MIRLIIWSILVVTVSIVGVTHSFDFMNSESQDRIADLVSECELYRENCQSMYDQGLKRISPAFDFVNSRIESQDSFKRISMIESVKKVLPYLKSKQQSIHAQDKVVMIQLLIMGFEDILKEVVLKSSSLSVSKTQIEAIQNNLLGNPILDDIRQSVVSQLIAHGFDGFVSRPYQNSLNTLQTEQTDRRQWKLNTTILQKDILDQTILAFIKDENNKGKDLWISKEEYEKREGIYLFKNAGDLEKLGYGVVSHRTRTNTDATYRRKNIATAFTEIGHLRVLNPGDSISYLGDSNFDPYEQQKYEIGKAIFLDEEIDDYGGGLCGGSTAIYQGSFLNRSLDFTKRNHSKRYTSLYTATINGEKQSMPGIDSTIYSPNLDLKVTNTATYPIILVMNYDGEYGTTEEIFTMSPNRGDEGSYEFVQSRNKGFTLQQKGGEERAVVGKCYEWKINDELSTRCYKEVF